MQRNEGLGERIGDFVERNKVLLLRNAIYNKRIVDLRKRKAHLYTAGRICGRLLSIPDHKLTIEFLRSKNLLNSIL